MPIEFRCTKCNRLLRTQDETAGKQAKCPECGTLLTIPAAAMPETPAASPLEQPFAPPPAAAESPFGQVPPPAGASASPFGESEPENPYASPQGVGAGFAGGAQLPSDVRAYAADRVAGPAIALIITGSLGLVLQILGTALNLVGVAMPQPGQDAEVAMISGGVGIALGILGVVLSVVVIVGALKMKNLASYGFAMTGTIIAMLPCISPCCLLGLPFGIWALVVLFDPQVRAAFETPLPR